MLFDDEAMYVGAWLFDRTPSAIVLGDQRRDASLDQSDALQIIIDTYRDRQNWFVFASNPNGIEFDGQVANQAQSGATGGGLQQEDSSEQQVPLRWSIRLASSWFHGHIR